MAMSPTHAVSIGAAPAYKRAACRKRSTLLFPWASVPELTCCRLTPTGSPRPRIGRPRLQRGRHHQHQQHGGHLQQRGYLLHGHQIVGIDVFDGSGFNTVTVQSTVSGVPVNIFGGANGEQFNLGTPGVTNGILSTINVDGGGGTDTLTVNDNLDTSARTITITSTQIGSASGDNLFGAGGVLNYTNVGTPVVNGGTGGNQIDLLSMNSGEVVDLFAGTAPTRFLSVPKVPALAASRTSLAR